MLDTRIGGPTVDNTYSGAGPIAAAPLFSLPVAGRGGVPGSGADAVALNVTVTNPSGPSFLTVWPAGESRPTASNLNFVAGQTIPNMVIAKVGAGGQVSIYNNTGSTDVIVDVLGWFPSGSYSGLNPARLLDTRAGGPTTDGQFLGIGPVAATSASNLTVLGRGGVPASGVGAVALNVTVTNPSGPSFLTVWPTGESRPTASNLNFVAGQTIPNMVIAKVGAGGQVSIYNNTGSTDVIVDVLGWFPTGSYSGLNPARLMDSRVVPVPPPPPPPSVTTVSPGTYIVNSTIAPGRYIAINAHSGCYWERLSGFGGSINEINANDFQNFVGPVIVDIAPTDVGFKFDAGCGTFRTYVAPASPANVIVPGAHVVGANILAGTYTTSASASCYWERRRGFGGALNDIIDNDFVATAGQLVVTISPTDVGFYADADCGTWTRI